MHQDLLPFQSSAPSYISFLVAIGPLSLWGLQLEMDNLISIPLLLHHLLASAEGPVLEEEILFPFSRLCRLDYLEGRLLALIVYMFV